MTSSLRGVFAAVTTPYKDDLSCDYALLARQCRRLLEEGCDGVSLFGTTGEGPALSVSERRKGLEAVLEQGVPAAKLLPAPGSASLSDTVELGRHAVSLGCTNLLVMPPFFFKNVSDEGVYAYYAELLDRVGGATVRYYLYNFPGVTGVAISRAVVGRLRKRFGDAIAGVKDSSGDMDYVRGLIADNPGLSVFSGWEILLRDLLAMGGAGNISGIANALAPVLRLIFDNFQDRAKTDRPAAALKKLVDTVTSMPVTPAVKELTAHLRGEPGWRSIRPPLTALTSAEAKTLHAAVKEFRVQVPA